MSVSDRSGMPARLESRNDFTLDKPAGCKVTNTVFIFDATLNDFVTGELESALVKCFEEARPDIMFIEGQSALRNPLGPCGSEFIISGQAKAVVLQHKPARRYFKGTEACPVEIPSVKSEIELIRTLGAETLALTPQYRWSYP
jgi:uncharacterized NAD-dependent epimerase/dehydratase family protein